MGMQLDHLSAGERLREIVPPSSYAGRMRRSAQAGFSSVLRQLAALVPGVGAASAENAPRLQPLVSDAEFMANWFRQPFGSAEKPAALEEMPWDYMLKHQEDVPFFGLREFWYPALMSDELRHNELKTIQLLGDNIVLFRDRNGAPAALDNRCPHRGALLSLGQVNVWDIGTITCRYHGLTFDAQGSCVAFLADGADSPACGRLKTKAYPTDEVGGIVWVYMGELEPQPLMDSMPHAREVLSPGIPVRARIKVPYSYLNQLDNVVDLSHVGCLHRTCYLFGDQKLGGGITFKELPGSGVLAELHEPGGHGGIKAIDEIRWYMPNLVHHGEEFLDGAANGIWFWFVPHDAGSFTGWMIGSMNAERVGKAKARMAATILENALQSTLVPGMSCFIGGDAPIQQSQGRVVRWDREQLMRIDRATLKVRSMMKAAHRREQEIRRGKCLDPLAHRITLGQAQGAKVSG